MDRNKIFKDITKYIKKQTGKDDVIEISWTRLLDGFTVIFKDESREYIKEFPTSILIKFCYLVFVNNPDNQDSDFPYVRSLFLKDLNKRNDLTEEDQNLLLEIICNLDK